MDTNMRRRPLGLTALFWRYLFLVGGLMLLSAAFWWLGVILCINQGFVLPASQAASQVEAAAEALSRDQDPYALPHYIRWALFDAEGDLLDSGGMDRRHQKVAQSALTGKTKGSFPYFQKHRIVPLADGRRYVLQFDYSTPYRSPDLDAVLPDFQITAIVGLLVFWGLLAGLCTRHYTRLLRQDTQAITAATQAIAQRRLEEPFSGQARVRELGAALEAMDLLRERLADSLKRQWSMEQQRQRELSALTHDLKTPLTIISGNGELLAEESLSPAQRENVDAILRGTERLEDYVGRLRVLTAGQREEEPTEMVPLAELYALWMEAGEGLCHPKGIRFQAEAPPALRLPVRREALTRAVLNLLDNAARYTGSGGTVTLSVQRQEGLLALSVTDTGPGFTPEALARAGRGLYTSDASRPQDGHTGWGLCYARQVAQDHGGTLRLCNTDHGGAAVLLLPVADAAE